MSSGDPIEILMVEDNPADVRLAQEAFKFQKLANNLHVAKDGLEALRFLKKEEEFADAITPDIVLLDLNLPKLSGQEVLAQVKNCPELKKIPVVVLTTSEAEKDIMTAYDNHANCYIAKPVDFEKFADIVRRIEGFWFSVVKLPNS